MKRSLELTSISGRHFKFIKKIFGASGYFLEIFLFLKGYPDESEGQRDHTRI
jgi:hypothetical protein